MSPRQLLASLCPPGRSAAADQHLKRQIGRLLFLRVLFLSLMLGSSVLLHSKEHPIVLPPLEYITYFIAGLYFLSILSILLLQLIRCYSFFGNLQIILDTLVVTVLVLATGGSQSIFPVVYFFPIVMGAFMLFRRGGILFAALSTILYGLVLFVEYRGLLPAVLRWQDTPLVSFEMVLHFFAIHGLSFFLVGLLASMLSARLQKAEADLFQTSADFDRLSSLYKQIFDDINTGIITVDQSGKISSFNRAAESISAFSAQEVLGQAIDRLFPGLRASGSEHTRPMIALTRKDGVVVPVGYTWARLNPVGNAESSLVFTLQDLSQIQEMEAKVRQAEKMATIGELAAGIAHELRNPLAAIFGAAQLLNRDRLKQQDEQIVRRLFGIIIRESERLEATIREFLLFARPVQPELDWFSFPALVEETLETLRQNPGWDEGLDFVLAMPTPLECRADPQLIRQVLINLLTNAANASRQTGKGEIVIEAGDDEGGFIFRVGDKGCGVPSDKLEAIFEPFFTTRENGTGLGLAIVRQIVESHGGTIRVENLGTQGAVFSVFLPHS